MKPIILISLIVALWFPVRAYAGDIYGTLWRDGRKLGGVPVEIVCRTSVYKGQTNQQGAYRMFVLVRGRCSFTVRLGERLSASIAVASYDDPIRYDFDLIHQPDGAYTLRRR